LTSFSQAGGGAANNPHLRLTQQYNWTFSEIGDVGNAPVTVDNWHPPASSTREAGSVGYRYNIATTEVTWGQYFEFIQAYAPVMPTNLRNGIVARDTLSNLTGGTGGDPSPITYLGPVGGIPQYTIDTSRADHPATSQWRLFARMVNWLHNGKKPASEVTSADFETGVYDTSTFVRLPNGEFTDQDRRSPGARFWIPSGDELVKATYYDPNKDGAPGGNAGYWLYGNSSDKAPIPGDPALGGQTNAGVDQAGFGLEQEWPEGQFRPLDVGSYPNEQSPWGLLDGAGGGAEWTEEWNHFIDEFQRSRMYFPAKAYSPLEFMELGEWRYADPLQYLSLRLAAAIPAPGAASLLALGALLAARRRR
jgi:hypothetical protein